MGLFSSKDKPQEDNNILLEPGTKPIKLNVLLIALHGQPRHQSWQFWDTGIQPGSPAPVAVQGQRLSAVLQAKTVVWGGGMNVKDAEW